MNSVCQLAACNLVSTNGAPCDRPHRDHRRCNDPGESGGCGEVAHTQIGSIDDWSWIRWEMPRAGSNRTISCGLLPKTLLLTPTYM